jgi:hypothetical protein
MSESAAGSSGLISVDGLLAEPLRRRDGTIYTGRFEVPRPLWVPNPNDPQATAALSIREIVDAASADLIYSDQHVQRGIKPERESGAEVELSLAGGYPDTDRYIFFPEKSDDIAEKLLAGETLYLNPLVWNLRPGAFEAYLDEQNAALYIYSGRIYLPDGHHRHQGIIKAFHSWREAPGDYPHFDVDQQFTVDIHFLSRVEEAEFFFQKNVLGKSVDRSKSYELTERDSLSVLAKRVIDLSPNLERNVNRVTDRLSALNPQVVTLSTLRSVMANVVEDEALTQERINALASSIAAFYELLAEVRPELRRVDIEERSEYRRRSLAGQAVVMYGFGELMRRFVADVERDDLDAARDLWRRRLRRLRPDERYTHGEFHGDFFARENPLWREIGVLQRTKSGRDAVSNVRQTRANVAEALLERLGIES